MLAGSPSHRWLRYVAAFAVLGLLAPAAFAIECGDTLAAGHHELDADLSCGFASGTPSILLSGGATLDLRQHTLRCTADLNIGPAGDGIWLEGARDRVTNGTIDGCGVAVDLRGEGRHEVSHLSVSGEARLLIWVESDRNRVHDVVASLGDGAFFVSGNQNLLTNNQSLSAQGNGFWVTGDRNRISHNSAVSSVCEAYLMLGAANRFDHNEADGGLLCNSVEVDGPDNIVEDNTIRNGPHDGIFVRGDRNRILRNTITSNRGVGIEVINGFTRNVIVENTVFSNGLDLFDQNPDCDHDVWSSNQFGSGTPNCVVSNGCSAMPQVSEAAVADPMAAAHAAASAVPASGVAPPSDVALTSSTRPVALPHSVVPPASMPRKAALVRKSNYQNTQ
jgi:parallel beta-helix repeat protein